MTFGAIFEVRRACGSTRSCAGGGHVNRWLKGYNTVTSGRVGSNIQSLRTFRRAICWPGLIPNAKLEAVVRSRPKLSLWRKAGVEIQHFLQMANLVMHIHDTWFHIRSSKSLRFHEKLRRRRPCQWMEALSQTSG